MWLTTWSYLTPTTLSLARVGGGVAAMRAAAEPLRALQPQFDASTHEVTQGTATSKDGTQVPYFAVRPKAASGPVPTILYGYGGFQSKWCTLRLTATGYGSTAAVGRLVTRTCACGGVWCDLEGHLSMTPATPTPRLRHANLLARMLRRPWHRWTYDTPPVSMTPKYVATAGVAWLEDGGCYVEANIRGGGEFGPTWHQAAAKGTRGRSPPFHRAIAPIS